ncbi:MAG: hypothetical protein GON13_02320 [Nanoarchaeota archaeon]|nr:hypothetical protein [Nanoarchaeota archaeon]
MQDKVIEELHSLELKLKRLGFKHATIEPFMQAIEFESFSLLNESLPGERLDNYFKFLNNKVDVISNQFVDRRKKSSEESRLWRHRANFQKSRIEGVMPDSEVSRALKFLIDKSFEL